MTGTASDGAGPAHPGRAPPEAFVAPASTGASRARGVGDRAARPPDRRRTGVGAADASRAVDVPTSPSRRPAAASRRNPTPPTPDRPATWRRRPPGRAGAVRPDPNGGRRAASRSDSEARRRRRASPRRDGGGRRAVAPAPSSPDARRAGAAGRTRRRLLALAAAPGRSRPVRRPSRRRWPRRSPAPVAPCRAHADTAPAPRRRRRAAPRTVAASRARSRAARRARDAGDRRFWTRVMPAIAGLLVVAVVVGRSCATPTTRVRPRRRRRADDADRRTAGPARAPGANGNDLLAVADRDGAQGSVLLVPVATQLDVPSQGTVGVAGHPDARRRRAAHEQRRERARRRSDARCCSTTPGSPPRSVRRHRSRSR